jgi:hypothetical protein
MSQLKANTKIFSARDFQDYEDLEELQDQFDDLLDEEDQEDKGSDAAAASKNPKTQIVKRNPKRTHHGGKKLR